MENAMNSYKKAWIRTYQEQVKHISSMNSCYEIMVFFMNSCFCVWISTYQEQLKAISSHEIIPQIMVWIHDVV
jgi:ABC-type antimicrobial peptide transport system permease subunit